MAERKSGPVKPPTIDLTAKSKETDGPKKPASDTAAASAAKPAGAGAPASRPPSGGDKTKPDAAVSGKKEDVKAASPSRISAMPLLAVGLAGTILGGALGLGGAYGLAVLGYWPATKTDTSAVAALSSEMSSLYVKKSDIGAVVDRAIANVDSGVSALDERVSALETAKPADNSPAISALDERVATLETGLKTLSDKLDAATISGGDAAAADAVAGLKDQMTSLSAKSDALTTKVAALETAGTSAASADAVTALGESVDALKSELAAVSSGLTALQSAPEPVPIDLRLPLALSGIAEALDTGAPFAADLDMIRAALPDLAIPQQVAEAATSGLGSPADLASRFEAKVPDILAARPADKRGEWTDQLWDRVKALVALRPVATGNDTSPEAEVARIEKALADRDFAAAASGFAALPEAMKSQAGGLGVEIGRFAATADLMHKARTAALSTTGAGS